MTIDNVEEKEERLMVLITRKLPVMIKVWLIIFAAVFFAFASYEKYKGNAARDWSPCEARITHSELKSERSSISRHGRGESETTHWAEIRGVFLDTQKPFCVSRVSYGENMVKSLYERYVKASPVGSTVTVYVSPKDPQEIILNNNPSTSGTTAIQIICGMLVIIGLLSLPGVKQPENANKRQVNRDRDAP